MMASLFGKSASFPLLLYFLLVADLLLLLPPRLCRAQSTPAPPPPVAPQDLCNGVFVSYQYNEGARIRPFLSDAASQPYSFKSTATILNAADVPLKSWNLFVGFRHREVLVSSDPAMLTDGSPLPARVRDNGTFFSGFPNADLNTAIDTNVGLIPSCCGNDTLLPPYTDPSKYLSTAPPLLSAPQSKEIR